MREEPPAQPSLPWFLTSETLKNFCFHTFYCQSGKTLDYRCTLNSLSPQLSLFFFGVLHSLVHVDRAVLLQNKTLDN